MPSHAAATPRDSFLPLQRHRDELVRASAVEVRAAIAASAFTTAIDKRKSLAVGGAGRRWDDGDGDGEGRGGGRGEAISLQSVADAAAQLLSASERKQSSSVGGARGRYPTNALSLNIPRAGGSGSEGIGGIGGTQVRCSFFCLLHLFFCLLIYSFVCSLTPRRLMQQPRVVDCIKQRRWRGDVFRTVVVVTPPLFSHATKGGVNGGGGDGGAAALATAIGARAASAFVATLATDTRRETNRWGAANVLSVVEDSSGAGPPVVVLTVGSGGAGRRGARPRSGTFGVVGESTIRLAPVRPAELGFLVAALKAVASAGADERNRRRSTADHARGMSIF
jgi:hypothetical protein